MRGGPGRVSDQYFWWLRKALYLPESLTLYMAVQCALPSAYMHISTRNIEQRCALPNAYMHTSTTWFLDCSTSANWPDQSDQDHNKQYRNKLDKDITAHLKLVQNF